ncbi:S1 family peptidase [Candidatus Methylopumilus turicensis]|jgi:tetratricopeptide (TPR) repeat protein|uniref:Serine protease n=1 Tax=Candidatus Methylopumilus turicensis TaxID=1581680 RepID=A0A0B7IX85_9PROT|nr:serine protease [Candidatus Methylopumilus turicensis]CEN55683.1 Peptidase S1 and S6 chymotrypsin/Hap [Candidatus Methylopumilus turicensis]
MKKIFLQIALISLAMDAFAAPPTELTFALKSSITKINSVNASGGRSTGTGIVVAENKVATNCHVLADSVGMNIGAMGETYQPIGLQADWKHDVCIMSFMYLPLKAATLGDSEHLQYEQEVFSIGFPGGPPKPLTTWGTIKALYPFEDSVVIRTSASFQMGASGSPLFDAKGNVVGISTFKSPGRNAFFYNIPVKWVKAALNLPVLEFSRDSQPAFWDVPLEQKPYWMQIVLPFQNEQWDEVASISKQWLSIAPNDIEALFYDAAVKEQSGRLDEAKRIFQGIIKVNPSHAASIASLANIAKKQGKSADVEAYKGLLAKLNFDNDEVEALLQLKGR